MQILLTNDDGIYADGIYAIYTELKKFAEVVVVAPESQRSSVGHGITLSHPIYSKRVKHKGEFFGHAISGTPADCVKFGVSVILKKKPDLVISGINLGDNDGCSVFYSGTVAGAREGALLDVPSMALSLATFEDEVDFSPAAKYGAKLAKILFQNKLPPRTFLNVNIPNLSTSKIKGIKFTRQGIDPIHSSFKKRFDPSLREYYWMTGKFPINKKDLTFDTYALREGYVTVTPIMSDSTDDFSLKHLNDWKI